MANAELISKLRGHIREVPLVLLRDAADALEAAEKRIAELEAQMPKEGEWIYTPLERYKEYKVKCPFCGAEYHDCYDGYIDAEDMNYCPNCGSKMKTVTDCHTLEEENG